MTIRKRTIGVLLACFIVLWLNSGSFDFVSDRIPTVVRFGAVGLWFFVACNTDRDFLIRFFRISWPVFIALLLQIVSNLFGRTVFHSAYFIRFVHLAIIQALFAYYFYDRNTKDVFILISVLFADVSIVTIRTFLIVLQNPIVARAISTSLEMQTGLLQNMITDGIGGYGLCYQLAFLTPCIGYLFNEKKRNPIAKFTLYLLIVLPLFQFQITMALLFSVAFIFGIEIIRSNGGKWSIVLVKTISLVAVVGVVLNFEAIIGFVVQFANFDLANRLNELLLLRSNGIDNAADLLSRFRLYSISISSFLENPIWGQFGNGPFGAHSTFLDLLASFGILGLFGICGMCKPLTILCKAYDRGSSERIYAFWITVAFVFFSILNVALWSDILLVCNLAIPLFFKISTDSATRT